MYMDKDFELSDEDEDIKMYEYAIECLKLNGYKQYEISNYAKEGYECKHNILYWKCKNYIGLGPGASGYINNGSGSLSDHIVNCFSGRLHQTLESNL